MPTDRRISFPPFALDLVNECLWEDARAIRLRPKAFAVLELLLTRPGELVSKDRLISTVWPDAFVGDAVLKVTIRQIREALSDNPKAPRFIETAHRRGYRFIGTIGGPASSLPPAASTGGPVHGTVPRGVPEWRRDVVGRGDALGRLHEWFDKAAGGDCQIVFVTGEAGIGKTTLLDMFARRIAADPSVRICGGQCLEQYGAGEAYLPVLDAIRQLCGLHPHIVGLLRTHAPMWLMQIPALTTAADRERFDRNPAATPERMLRAMGDLLEALTATSPLVLMLEDLHWSDVSTLDLISYLARRRRAAHLMVIATDRPADLNATRHPLKGLKQELLARRQCEELALGYLSQDSVGHYLAERFPANEFADDVGALIHRRTSGNPLFMVSTVDHLLANGTIECRAGTWTLTVPIDTLTSVVPDSVRQLVDALADRLNPQDRETLEAASVAGMEFSTAAVAAALGDDEAAVERRSEDLSRRHVLIRELGVETWPDEKPVGRFGFTHAVYRDALYERLSTARRMQWHRRVAARGEAVYGTRAREFAAELAMHFEHAGDWPRAAHYLQHAAVNATRRGAYRDAVALARRGLDLLIRVPDSDARAREELRLQVSLGAPLMAIDGYAAATVGVVYGEARRLCDRVSDAPERSHVLWGLWTHHALRAELSTALTLAGELLDVADRAPARDVAMRGHWAMEITSTHQGNFRLALQHFEQALALYESDDHSQAQVVDPLDAGVAVRCFAAWCWWFRGRPDTALRNIHDAIAHARDISDTHGLAHALAFAAVLHQLRGERELAHQQVLAVVELTEQHGLAFYGAMAQIVGGWARVTAANGEAIAQMRTGLESWESTGARLMRPYFLTLIADASDTGGDDPALALLADAVRVAESTGERWYEAEAYRLRGDRLLKQPRTHSTLEAAETCYRRSLEIARRQEALALELRAAVSLARLPARHDRASRLGAVRDAYERFEEGFDTVDLREARRVLEQADR